MTTQQQQWLMNLTYLRATFSSVQLLSHILLVVTPWTAACQASLSINNFQSPPKPMYIVSVMPSNHLILCRPLLPWPSIFPSIRVFPNVSALHIRWPKVLEFQLQHQSLQWTPRICFCLRYFFPISYKHSVSPNVLSLRTAVDSSFISKVWIWENHSQWQLASGQVSVIHDCTYLILRDCCHFHGTFSKSACPVGHLHVSFMSS